MPDMENTITRVKETHQIMDKARTTIIFNFIMFSNTKVLDIVHLYHVLQ